MKKRILIISGIIAALLIILAWGYLFIYGAPAGTADIFANFRGGDEPRIPAETLREGVIVDTRGGDAETLRQLTTKPVAGVAFATEDIVWYVEQGTGYIYSINLRSGEELPVSGTTHTKVVSAKFSPRGNAVIFTTETSRGLQTSIEFIIKDDEGHVGLVTANEAFNVENAVFSADGETVVYTSNAPSGSQVYAYNLEGNTIDLLQNLPFSETVISWGNPVYVSVKPASSLMGFVYRIAEDSLERLRDGGFGLTAFGYDGGFVTTEILDEEIVSYAFEDRVYQIPIPLFPEKCVPIPATTSLLVCAAPYEFPQGRAYPDDWYTGALSLEDSLWFVDIHREEAVLLADPLSETGRAIDVSSITANADGSAFLLVNKNDNTLWLFEPQDL